MKKTWYVFGSLLILFAMLLSACTAEESNESKTGVTPGSAAQATQAALATGVTPGYSAPVQPATGVTPAVATPTRAAATAAAAIPVTPTHAAATAAVPVVQVPVEQRPYLASTLLGMPVWNTLEGKLANIGGLVMDSATGVVSYALVNAEGGLHPVPFSLFKVVDTNPTNNDKPQDTGDLALLLPITKSQLDSSPTIAKSELDNPAVTGWAPGIQNYWAQAGGALPVTGKEPVVPAKSPVIIRDSGMFGGIGYDVENYQHNELGSITNFVVNPDGVIQYAILKISSFLNMGSKQLLVPVRSLVYNPDNHRFLLPVDENWLNQAASQTGLASDTGPDYFWNKDWHVGPDAFWANFKPIEQPVQPVPGQATPVAPVAPAAELKNGMFSTARFVPAPVVAPNGDSLGTVSNLAYEGGRLKYVIISVAQGFAAVPWQAFQWDQANQRLVYVENLNWLAGAPVVGKADVFAGNDLTWERPVFDYWKGYLHGLGGNAAFGPNAQVLYYARFNDTKLVDSGGVELGKVTDVLVDGQGDVHYLLVSRNGKLFPVPWKLFTWDAQNNRLVYTGQVNLLDTAPSLASLDNVNLLDPAWDAQIKAFWR